MNTLKVPASSQSVCRLCMDVVPTLRGRCMDVVRTLCAPTVCQVLIVCRCCVDVVRSTHEMCADVVWTLCGRFVVKRPTSHKSVDNCIPILQFYAITFDFNKNCLKFILTDDLWW